MFVGFRRIRAVIFSLSLLAISSFVPSYAQDNEPDYMVNKLTGDWGGLRDRLGEEGYTFDVLYHVNLWRNVSGGVRQGNRVFDNLDMMMSVDGEKALGLHGTSLFLHALGNNGGRINDLAGSHGGIDNMEVPAHAVRLYQAWIQPNFMNDRLSILAGLHDLNSEFYVTDTSALFLNPALGIGTEMASTGDNGPSVFPVTSVGVRLAVRPTAGTYLMGAVYDGVPGDPDNPRGTHIHFNDKDGALLVMEGGLKDDDTGHFGVGAWRYTAKHPDQMTGEAAHSQGVYVLADRSLYHADDKDISAFARLGYAAGNVEQFRSNVSAGFVASGFIPSRPDGQIGVALSSNINADKFEAANGPMESVETQFEITYADRVTPWLSVQPDLHYTVNPGTDPSLSNSWTVGIRLGVDF